MKKYTVNMVRHWLSGSVKSVWLGMETLDYENGICLLDEQLTQLDPRVCTLDHRTPCAAFWILGR